MLGSKDTAINKSHDPRPHEAEGSSHQIMSPFLELLP